MPEREREIKLDEEKIITMTKLAIYDKDFAAEDENVDRFFRHDFIYRQNMWIRFYVLLGCLVIILFRALHMVVIEQRDLMALNIRAELTKAVIFIIVAEVAYTIIGMIRYTVVYERSQDRIREYYALLDKLEPPAADGTRATKVKTRKERDLSHGTTSPDTRKHHKVL